MIGITGSTGVLGTVLCDQLRLSGTPFVVYKQDIRDSNSILNWLESNQIDKVVHLAAVVAVHVVSADKDSAYDVNINGVLQLIKAVRTYGKPVHIFFASSSHVYKSSNTLISESDPIAPLNTYGLTKYIGELLLEDFEKSTSNVTLCIGRIFSFYHPLQKPPFLYPSLIKRFQEEDLNQPFKLHGALSVRDFLSADEVCEKIIKLLDIKAVGIYNIASGKSTTIKEFASFVAGRAVTFEIDTTEPVTYLVADTSKFNTTVYASY